jgi:lysophospholipase L1-like esterase
MEGINDIGETDAPGTPADENISAQQVIDGMKQLIARAHAKGIRIWGGTLTPFRDTTILLYSAASEAKRQTVNNWIRNGRAFDAVIDFDRVMRDPDHPERLLRRFDSGDHLHPNDSGYKAMARAVDLRLFN